MNKRIKFTINFPDSINSDQNGVVHGNGSKLQMDMPRKDLLILAYNLIKMALGIYKEPKFEQVANRIDNRVWKEVV